MYTSEELTPRLRIITAEPGHDPIGVHNKLTMGEKYTFREPRGAGCIEGCGNGILIKIRK